MLTTIARILLGLIFVAGGVAGFLMTPPPMPGVAGKLTAGLHDSHWTLFVAFAQIVAGLLLLVNRYVPVALIVIAAFLYNSFAFHLTTMPATVPLPIVVTILWLVVALRYRAVFAPIFRP